MNLNKRWRDFLKALTIFVLTIDPLMWKWYHPERKTNLAVSSFSFTIAKDKNIKEKTNSQKKVKDTFINMTTLKKKKQQHKNKKKNKKKTMRFSTTLNTKSGTNVNCWISELNKNQCDTKWFKIYEP